MKKCAFCAEEIQDEAILCRFCGRGVAPELKTSQAEAKTTPSPTSSPTDGQQRTTTGRAKLKPRIALQVLLAGFAVSLFPATWGLGVVALWVGLMMLLWRPTYSGGAVMLTAFLSLLGATVLQIPGGWLKDRQESAEAAAQQIEREKQAAETRKQAELRAGEDFKRLQSAIAANQWREAAKLNAQIKVAHAGLPGRADAEKTINEQLRLVDIRDGIAEAERVVSNDKQCATLKAVSDVWNKLRQVRASDTEWAQAGAATRKLEECRKRIERELSAGLRQIMVGQREAWAAKADTAFLDQGMNVTITLSGTNKDRVTLKWALMSRAAMHKLTDGGSMATDSFLGGLQKIGFRRVTFTDGFDDSWFYDLNPQDEANGGILVLREQGLAAPLTLTQ